jgi:hypothetical protein
MTGPDTDPDEVEVALTGGGRTAVSRRGQTVLREAGPWSRSVHALLKHLEEVGFTGAPRVVGAGFDGSGREMLTYLEGGFVHPGPWSDDGVAHLGLLLRKLHSSSRADCVRGGRRVGALPALTHDHESLDAAGRVP